MNTATAAITIIGKCSVCNILTNVERETFENGWPTIGHFHVDCKDCGRRTNSKTAKVSAIKCGPKCYNATGPSCSCECGGKNHGGH